MIGIETAMAKAQMDNVARRDPKNVNNKMSFEQVQALTPSFDWKKYTADIGAPLSAPHYLVLTPNSSRSWKCYPAALGGGLAGLLALATGAWSGGIFEQGVRDENWDFFAHALFGSKQQLPRWRRCVRAADRDLGMALGQAYVAAAFPAGEQTADGRPGA